MLAAVRTDAVNFPLFLHVLGALLLTGALLVVCTTAFMSWKRDTADGTAAIGLNRVALRTVFYGVFPAYLLMRIGAQWTSSKEGLDNIDPEPAWLTTGYIAADSGALLIVISMILSGIGLRKLRSGKGRGLTRATAIIATLVLIAAVVTIWAMSAKPV